MKSGATVFKGKNPKSGISWKREFEQILKEMGVSFSVCWGGYWNFDFEAEEYQIKELINRSENEDDFPAMID